MLTKKDETKFGPFIFNLQQKNVILKLVTQLVLPYGIQIADCKNQVPFFEVYV